MYLCDFSVELCVRNLSEVDLQTFQQSVADSLAQIEGAGRVEVLLSLEAGEESVYASDVSQSSQSTGGSSDSTSEIAAAARPARGKKPPCQT